MWKILHIQLIIIEFIHWTNENYNDLMRWESGPMDQDTLEFQYNCTMCYCLNLNHWYLWIYAINIHLAEVVILMDLCPGWLCIVRIML